MPKKRSIAILTVMILFQQSMGCSSFRPVAPETLPTESNKADQARIMTVTKEDGASMDLYGVWIHSDVVRGLLPGYWEAESRGDYEVEVQGEEVVRIGQRQNDLRKTSLLAVGIGGGVLAVYGLATWGLLELVFGDNK